MAKKSKTNAKNKSQKRAEEKPIVEDNPKVEDIPKTTPIEEIEVKDPVEVKPIEDANVQVDEITTPKMPEKPVPHRPNPPKANPNDPGGDNDNQGDNPNNLIDAQARIAAYLRKANKDVVVQPRRGGPFKSARTGVIYVPVNIFK